MHRFSLLVLALVATSVGHAQAPQPQVQIEGAPFVMSLPTGWIRIPEDAMARFRQPRPGFQSVVIAGFAGPRPPANTSMTIVLVQMMPATMTPQGYLDSDQASFDAAKKAMPGLVKDPIRIGFSGRAAICSLRGNDGQSGRTYIFPTSGGLVEFVLFCPAATALTTFSTFEGSLAKLTLTGGHRFDLKWIAELQKLLGPAPKRVY